VVTILMTLPAGAAWLGARQIALRRGRMAPEGAV
jgi:hypothetical protein